ncbi:uncharacterized protein LOC110432227 isoform X1 [Sorghum bicolor]|uniref:uncharacterized protein LOC110432227 isoform X1 n=1 Tax=Sorghum bicolor TaxID=4558 RepID=UPI000B424246|nr:uncharacterized protein LOC110432227 isoform X1 [Sorghum bicolor]|eukprot:XP_021307899.1 uncharacterized protein LOC110432227 isoform X1 [Sorghum bicolor]
MRPFGRPPPRSLGPTGAGFSQGIKPGLQTWGVIPRLFPSTQLPSVASPPPRLNSPPLPPLGPHLDFSSIAATVQHQHHRLLTLQMLGLRTAASSSPLCPVHPLRVSAPILFRNPSSPLPAFPRR